MRKIITLLLLFSCLIGIAQNANNFSISSISTTAQNQIIFSPSQVVGADISYSSITKGKYEITLTVFYSCLLNEADVKKTEEVVIFEAFGSKANPPFSLKLISSEKKTKPQSNVCSQTEICIIEAIYKGEIELMPVPHGYNIVWNSCCIQSPLSNLDFVNNVGFNIVAHITDANTIEKNSMPTFNNLPVTNVCVNQTTNVNINGADKDGDSLVYELQAPLAVSNNSMNNASTTTNSNAPSRLPDPPPYPEVKFANGYSFANPLGNKAITLNKQTGVMQIKVAATGNYLLGYSIKEYRKGILLSANQRVIIISVQP